MQNIPSSQESPEEAAKSAQPAAQQHQKKRGIPAWLWVVLGIVVIGAITLLIAQNMAHKADIKAKQIEAKASVERSKEEAKKAAAQEAAKKAEAEKAQAEAEKPEATKASEADDNPASGAQNALDEYSRTKKGNAYWLAIFTSTTSKTDAARMNKKINDFYGAEEIVSVARSDEFAGLKPGYYIVMSPSPTVDQAEYLAKSLSKDGFSSYVKKGTQTSTKGYSLFLGE